MNEINEDNIDLFDLLKNLYKKRKLILVITLIFTLTGLSISVISPLKFSSSTIFIPQNQENNSSSLSGVASLVGINLSNSNFGGEIPSSMYPQISESTKFKRLLLSKKLDNNSQTTLMDYLTRYYNLDYDLKDSTNGSDIYVSELEEKCFEIISKIISINVNQKDGFVTITSIMPRADYSAYLTNYAKEILQKIIIENKIESARQNLIYSENQLFEKKILFDEIQSKLSYFSDSNLNSVNSFVINERDKLEAEFQIINAVVTELSKQVEKAKLQVKKDTPVFSTIQEAVIPNKKSSPKRALITILSGFTGFIFSLLYVILKKPILKIYSQLND